MFSFYFILIEDLKIQHAIWCKNLPTRDALFYISEPSKILTKAKPTFTGKSLWGRALNISSPAQSLDPTLLMSSQRPPASFCGILQACPLHRCQSVRSPAGTGGQQKLGGRATGSSWQWREMEEDADLFFPKLTTHAEKKNYLMFPSTEAIYVGHLCLLKNYCIIKTT